MFTVTVDPASLMNIQRIADAIDTFGNLKDNPETLIPAVYTMGQHLVRNYNSRGAEGPRRWQKLTPYTKAVRERRGYGNKPIMEQRGSLRAWAVDSIAVWGMSDRRKPINVQPSSDDGTSGGATGAMSVVGGKFTARITGPKVVNQTGGRGVSETFGVYQRGRTPGYIPPRPFWYVDHFMVEEMAAKLELILWGRFARLLPGVSGPINTKGRAIPRINSRGRAVGWNR